MRKVTLLFINLVFIFSLSNAQVIDTLPVNQAEFIPALKDRFEATNRSDLKDLFKELDSQIKSGEMSDKVLDNFISATNHMLKLRGKAFPQIQLLLRSYLDLNQLTLNPSEWEQFQKTLETFMDNSKPGDLVKIQDFIDFTIPLFRENALWYSKRKIWQLSTDQFILSYEENGPKVKLSQGDFFGKTPDDSIQILNTSGTYNYLTKIWEGEAGMVNWERAGLSSSEVYATFGNYTIDLRTKGYSIDSVEFTFKNYFNQTIKGQLEDKMSSVADIESLRFPRFSAPRENVPVLELTKNVTYHGGFTLAG